jgi:hypothetical protein
MLHEPYIPAVEMPVHSPVETVLVSTVDGVQEAAPIVAAKPVTVHNARNHAEARAAHLTRIDAAKTLVRIVPPKPTVPAGGAAGRQGLADPLDVIRQRVTINPRPVAEMRRVIHQARQHAAQGDAAPRGLPGDPLRSARAIADLAQK